MSPLTRRSLSSTPFLCALRYIANIDVCGQSLYYIHAEPKLIPGCGSEDGTPIDEAAKATHRQEVAAFAEAVERNEVKFVACTYGEMLEDWQQHGAPDIRRHAENVMQCFSP